jgi:hypothetical protein
MSSDDEIDSPGSPVEMLPTLRDEGDICADGSIMKEIITKGTGLKKPTKVQLFYDSKMMTQRAAKLKFTTLELC